jgi:hypothetical protein
MNEIFPFQVDDYYSWENHSYQKMVAVSFSHQANIMKAHHRLLL